MRNQIVSDGATRLRESKAFKARKAALWNSIRAKHSDNLSAANLFKKCILHYQMRSDFTREWKKIAPSAHALYFGI